MTDPDDTIVDIELEYFNTASAKIILSLFKKISKVKEMGKELKINWSYTEDDEIIRDSGFDFAKLARLDFNMIEKAC